MRAGGTPVARDRRGRPHRRGNPVSANDLLIRPSPLAGRVLVEVPWGLAESARARLAKAGVAATLCLDPAARRAALEVPRGVPPDALLAALCPPGQAA